ncbi:Protein-L-isoaspartate O-methyltransferase [Minicystis rosea]|nr:Protein-L-isoaspartate O-methyltransferase [Minicystis rosea]
MIFDFARRDLRALAEPHARPASERTEPVSEAVDRAVADDRALWTAAMRARQSLVLHVTGRLGGLVSRTEVSRFTATLLAVPRERFVLPEHIASSADDVPSPLDEAGLATVSAPHAYVLTYAILGLREGDHLVELGTGTGYGAALASHVVGAGGQVTSIEIDKALYARARRLLDAPDARGPGPIALHCGDARVLALDLVATARGDARPLRIAFTYALSDKPESMLALLPEGGRLVAPVGPSENRQKLVLWTREHGSLREETHGSVRYVTERR